MGLHQSASEGSWSSGRVAVRLCEGGVRGSESVETRRDLVESYSPTDLIFAASSLSKCKFVMPECLLYLVILQSADITT